MIPVLSRRSVNPVVAARGMRSAAELAEGRPCGTRIRYYAGCRCVECRAANTAYERERAAARKRGEHNRLVPAGRARDHLLRLSKLGVGRKTAADAAKVANSIVSMIIDGQRLQVREKTERRILAVTEAAAADGARRDARATWRMLDELIAAGYSKARIASEVLGRPVRSLQISRQSVTVRTEYLVRGAWERLRLADAQLAKRAHKMLADLREEGFRPDRIQREVYILAAARGWSGTSIAVQASRGRWPGPNGMTHRAATLLLEVHAALTEVPK